jgi:hypothetical protein
MKIKVINSNIIYLAFTTQKELTLTLCRAQEYYECNSTKLRNKVFTFYDFVDHYLDESGYISYFNYWSGFNIPGDVLELFFQNFELNEREKKLFKITRKVSDNPYYVIATKVNDDDTLDHELLHAHYYLNHSYRQKVNTVVKHMRSDLRKELSVLLKELGYTKDVMVDEINAYLATSSYKYLKDELELNLSRKDIKPFRDLAKNVLRD